MNFNVIASGSSGNCYCIENNGHFIFVDAGATLTSIRKGFLQKSWFSTNPANSWRAGTKVSSSFVEESSWYHVKDIGKNLTLGKDKKVGSRFLSS